MSSTGRTERSILDAVDAHRLDPGAAPGDWASDPVHLVDAERTVGMYARALAAVHCVAPPGQLAADASLGAPRIVDDARERVRSGRVGEHSVSPPYRHLSVDRLLQVLDDGTPELLAGQLALTHGRPVLGRLRCSAGEALGFVEWDAAAWADPHRDLAVAAREIADVLVPVLVPVFFEQYGAARADWRGPDPLRLDWYALASELGA